MQSYPFNGFSDNRANYPYVPSLPVPAPQVPPYPHIVGEGDVASVTLPDGTLQLYFVPARTPPYHGANYQPWDMNPAWFIRTIPNIFPAPVPQSPAQSQHTVRPNEYPFFHDVAEVKSLHFHNDQTTSSSDIRYFSQQPQPMETCSWLPKQSAETQVDQPVKLYDVVCHCRRPRTDPEKPVYMPVDGITERINGCYCEGNSCSNVESKAKATCECKMKYEERQTSEKCNCNGITLRISACSCNKGKSNTFSETESKVKAAFECKINEEKRQTSEQCNDSVRERGIPSDQFSQTTKKSNCNNNNTVPCVLLQASK